MSSSSVIWWKLGRRWSLPLVQGIADVVNTRLRLLAKAAKFVKLLVVHGQMQIAFLFSEDNQSVGILNVSSLYC